MKKKTWREQEDLRLDIYIYIDTVHYILMFEC